MTSKFNLNQRIQQLEKELNQAQYKLLEQMYQTNFDLRMWTDQAEKVLNEAAKKNK